jgi:hypothetical protein
MSASRSALVVLSQVAVELEVYDAHHDPGVGNGSRITMASGRLVGMDDAAQSVLDGMRKRHPHLGDAALARRLDGWSNGWSSIRQLPA